MLEWIPLRQSRQLPEVPGIYAIRHVDTHMEYIGQSKNVRTRIASHRSARAWHYLGRALRSHGLDKFEVCLLLACAAADLGRLEQETILARGSMAPAGYNLSEGGLGPTGVTWSDERKAAQSARVRGVPLTAAAREKMSAAALANNPFKGRKHTAEARAKISAANVRNHTGMKRSDEARANIAASLKGRKPTKLSEEGRARIVAVRLGKKFPGTGLGGDSNPMYGVRGGSHPSAVRVMVWRPEGLTPWQIFNSATEAAAWAGVKVASISDWCSGRYRPKSGLLWAKV